MKKVILGLIISTIGIMATEVETVNIKKALYSEYSYEVKTVMNILSQDKKTSKSIPATIKYNNKKILKTKNGFKAESSIILGLVLPNNIISEVKTKTKYFLDKKYTIVSMKEETIIDGKSTLVSCSVVGKKNTTLTFNKNIGFKESISFNCSDKLLRVKEIELRQSHLGKNMLEIKDTISSSGMKSVDLKRILIDKLGNIDGISEDLRSEIFQLKYNTTDIK